MVVHRIMLLLSMTFIASCDSSIGQMANLEETAEEAANTKAFVQKQGEILLSGPLQYRSIPDQFVSIQPLPLTSFSELSANLQRRGSLTISRAKLELDLGINRVFAMNELTLSDAEISTGGSDITIFVSTLRVDDRSRIKSFMQWQNPETWVAGVGGGTLKIYVFDRIEGLPIINLTGGLGGPGIPGLVGDQGREGDRGRSARNGDFGTCRRGPGKGGNGYPGEAGGRGGPGGAGGSGGNLEIYFVNRPVQNGVTTYFTSEGGRGGPGGVGGPGGPGGIGGLGGSNAGNCSHRSPERNRGEQGPTGPQGPRGETGETGPRGTVRVQGITIPR